MFQNDDRPSVNDTGELAAVDSDAPEEIAVNNFLEFKCPGGNITDEGRSISLQCIGNKQFETRDTWPACRKPEVCGVNDTLPVQGEESKTSGFNCNWQDTEEFVTIDCNCTDPTKVMKGHLVKYLALISFIPSCRWCKTLQSFHDAGRAQYGKAHSSGRVVLTHPHVNR